MAELDINSPVFQNRIDQLKEAKDEVQRLQIIKQLFRLIQQNTDSITKSMQEGMTVNNMDEVHAMMVNEGKRNIGSLLKGIEALRLSQEEQSQISDSLMTQLLRDMKSDFKTVAIHTPRDIVTVNNLDEIFFPTNIKINNLDELQEHFDMLASVVRDTFNINIPTPQVNVEAPQINIPDTVIDFTVAEARLKKIAQSLNKIKNNSQTNPLAVRFSDGSKFIDKLDEIAGATRQVVAAYSNKVDLHKNAKVSLTPGNMIDANTSADPFRVNENHATAQTNNVLKTAPGASKNLYIRKIVLSNGATAGSIQLVEDTGGSPVILFGPYYLGANAGAVITLDEPWPLNTNVDLGFTSTTVTTHTVTVQGYTR